MNFPRLQAFGKWAYLGKIAIDNRNPFEQKKETYTNIQFHSIPQNQNLIKQGRNNYGVFENEK